MLFQISRRARRQIEKIHAWWTDNRPAAPSLFLDELDKVEHLLRSNPELGIVYAVHRSGAIRRSPRSFDGGLATLSCEAISARSLPLDVDVPVHIDVDVLAVL